VIEVERIGQKVRVIQEFESPEDNTIIGRFGDWGKNSRHKRFRVKGV